MTLIYIFKAMHGSLNLTSTVQSKAATPRTPAAATPATFITLVGWLAAPPVTLALVGDGVLLIGVEVWLVGVGDLLVLMAFELTCAPLDIAVLELFVTLYPLMDAASVDLATPAVEGSFKPAAKVLSA